MFITFGLSSVWPCYLLPSLYSVSFPAHIKGYKGTLSPCPFTSSSRFHSGESAKTDSGPFSFYIVYTFCPSTILPHNPGIIEYYSLLEGSTHIVACFTTTGQDISLVIKILSIV